MRLTRLASIFLWLLVDIILWGFISRYLGSLGQATFGFVTVILGAIILWEFVSRIQQGMMTSFLEDIWTQNFINYFASPLRIAEYLSGLVLTSITADPNRLPPGGMEGQLRDPGADRLPRHLRGA